MMKARSRAGNRAARRFVPPGVPHDCEERLLHDVVAGVPASHVNGVADDRGLITHEKTGDRIRIALARALEQPLIVHSQRIPALAWKTSRL
jgi:hypothetical protein